MPAKAGAAARGSSASPPRTPSYRRPSPDQIRRAALKALRSGPRKFASQSSLRETLSSQLRREDSLFRLGGRRMRLLLLDVPEIRVVVRYAERKTRTPLTRCPVCSSELRPIRNETLQGDRVVLGYRCTRCSYWTHLKRRVPVRYSFFRTGLDDEKVG